MLREKWLSLEALPPIPGIELLNDIDRVLISSPGDSAAEESTDPPVLVAIRGRFDPVKVRRLFTRMGAAPQLYNSFQVYRPPAKDAKDTAWVLLDARTILLGDARSIFAALDRNQFTLLPPQNARMMARASELDAKYEIWVMMNAAEVMSSDRLATLVQASVWAPDAQDFELGINLSSGLTADATLRFSSEATAKRRATELIRATTLTAAEQGVSAQVHDIARKLKFRPDGSTTKISLRLTPLELVRSAGVIAGAAQPIPNSAPPLVLPPVSPPGSWIRIEGLDEGTRKVPYEESQH